MAEWLSGLLKGLSPKSGAQSLLPADTDQPVALPEAKHPVLDYLLGGQSGLDSARERSAQNMALQTAAAQRQQATAAAKQLFPDNQQMQLLAAAKPDVFFSTIAELQKPQKLAASETSHGPNGDYTAPPIEKPNKPQPFNMGTAGIAEYDPDTRTARLLYEPPHQQQVPAGYRLNPDGTMAAITGGPADPRVAGARATAMRAPPKTGLGGPLGTMSNEALVALAKGMR